MRCQWNGNSDKPGCLNTAIPIPPKNRLSARSLRNLSAETPYGKLATRCYFCKPRNRRRAAHPPQPTHINSPEFFFNHYTLDATDKPWLPLAAPAQTGAEPAYLLDSKPAQGADALPTISLAQLRASVDTIAALLKAGEGIAGYENCARHQLHLENESRYHSPGSHPLDTDEISQICRR